ncbi:MAG: RDD family protein [Bacteroidetes bacterium]|nr:RDD family protein [Bacteroidota bacterium]
MSDSARILTTQNVAINYQTANIGERLLARLLDLVFFTAYLMIAFFILGEVVQSMKWEDQQQYSSVIGILIPVPILTYTLWCESIFNGRTIGKIIMGLKVVKTNGTPAGIGDFAFRWATRLFEGELGALTCLALPVAIISNKTQRIGDMIAGTIVIKTKQKSFLRNTILANINPNYRVVFPQVANLSDRDLNIIRDVMAQSFETGNHRLLEYLGHKVKTVMGVYPPPQQLPTAQFLNIVLADYAHFAFSENS